MNEEFFLERSEMLRTKIISAQKLYNTVYESFPTTRRYSNVPVTEAELEIEAQRDAATAPYKKLIKGYREELVKLALTCDVKVKE